MGSTWERRCRRKNEKTKVPQEGQVQGGHHQGQGCLLSSHNQRPNWHYHLVRPSPPFVRRNFKFSGVFPGKRLWRRGWNTKMITERVNLARLVKKWIGQQSRILLGRKSDLKTTTTSKTLAESNTTQVRNSLGVLGFAALNLGFRSFGLFSTWAFHPSWLLLFFSLKIKWYFQLICTHQKVSLFCPMAGQWIKNRHNLPMEILSSSIRHSVIYFRP